MARLSRVSRKTPFCCKGHREGLNLGRYKLPRFRQIFGPFLSDWLSEFRQIVRGGGGGCRWPFSKNTFPAPPPAPISPPRPCVGRLKNKGVCAPQPFILSELRLFPLDFEFDAGPALASAVRTGIFLTYGHRRTPVRGAAEGST